MSQVDDYAISELGGAKCTEQASAHASPPAPAASGLTQLLRNVGATSAAVNKLGQVDLASQMELCHQALERMGEREELRGARITYYYTFYSLVGLLLSVDMLRLCGLSHALGDLLLGFSSQRAEARRFRWMMLGFLPALHLGYFYTSAFRVPCCVATPKLEVAFDRVRALMFLLFVSVYCLLADAHHHGFFLLRIADGPRSAVRLLRDVLGNPPPRLGEAVELQGLREGEQA